MFYFITSLLIALSVIIFAVSNTQIVTIQFLRWQFEGSLAFILIMACVVGVIFTLTVIFPSFIKYFINISRLKKKLRSIEAENSLIKKKNENKITSSVTEQKVSEVKYNSQA